MKSFFVISKSKTSTPKTQRSPSRLFSRTSTKDKEGILKIGNYFTQMYLSFIQHKSLIIVCNPEVTFFDYSNTRISLKDHEWMVLRIIWGDSTTNLKGSNFLCWMGERYVCIRSFPPSKDFNPNSSPCFTANSIMIYALKVFYPNDPQPWVT